MQSAKRRASNAGEVQNSLKTLDELFSSAKRRKMMFASANKVLPVISSESSVMSSNRSSLHSNADFMDNSN